MSTSGLYTYDPSLADLYLEAFGRIQIEGPAITRGHIAQARRSANLLLQDWGTNRGVNLWAVDLQTIPLVAGQAQYTVDPATITVLDVYYNQVNGAGAGVDADRIMVPMSRDDYAEIPNKLQAGTPTRYWFEKLAVSAGTLTGGAATGPVMTIWQPALAGQIGPTYNVKFYRMRRLQDADPSSGQQVDIHYRFLDAFAGELAERLAEKYKPELVAQPGNRLERTAKLAWDRAVSSDREDTPITIVPMLGGYGRR